MTYVDPRNIVDVIERQYLKIREQKAQIAALQAEVERLKLLSDEINEMYQYLINDRPEGLAD